MRLKRKDDVGGWLQIFTLPNGRQVTMSRDDVLDLEDALGQATLEAFAEFLEEVKSNGN